MHLKWTSDELHLNPRSEMQFCDLNEHFTPNNSGLIG